MTDDELKQDKAFINAAITAPWMATQESEHRWLVVDGNGLWVADCGNDEKSAKAIAAARTRWPAALMEIEKLRAEVALIRGVETSVNDAINRAGIHCAVTFAEGIDMITSARDEARAEVHRLNLEDREAMASRNILADALVVIDGGHSTSLVACADRAAEVIKQLRAEVEAMRPVVDAAVGYCLAPSACWQAEVRLVEAAGLYHANRRISENAPVLEASVVRTGQFAMGAECSSCGHRHAGADVGHICIGCPCEERPVDIAERA